MLIDNDDGASFTVDCDSVWLHHSIARAKLKEILASSSKHLDATIITITHNDRAIRIDCYSTRMMELAGSRAKRPKPEQKRAVLSKDLHSMVPGIDDDPAALGVVIDRHAV